MCFASGRDMSVVVSQQQKLLIHFLLPKPQEQLSCSNRLETLFAFCHFQMHWWCRNDWREAEQISRALLVGAEKERGEEEETDVAL